MHGKRKDERKGKQHHGKEAAVFLHPASIHMVLLFLCAAEKTVYLGASDAAEGDGSEAAPFNSLAKAIEAVQSGGRIVVTETYTVTDRDAVTADIPRFLAPTHEGKIAITSLDGKLDYRRGGACIYFPETYIYECGGDVRFENVTLKNDAAPIYLAGNFHALEFGEGFDVKNTKGVAKYLYVIGGYYAPRSKDFPADRDADITIDNGNFARVIAFGMGEGRGYLHLHRDGAHPHPRRAYRPHIRRRDAEPLCGQP